MPRISDAPEAWETPPRIVVDAVRKSFRLRHTHSFKETFVAAMQRTPISTEFNALNGVSFSIGEGEAVALLGFNGSGKSTMLKLISGVLSPDSGDVLTRGRVAGLIEVGAGFHPDLSGRENIYLNAAILGMTKEETDRRFDDIVAFSEIEKFIDTEVKHYSSGMFLRLAFAVAIHTEQDVLLIDEILSVGDEPFQKKCIARIRELHAAGKTLVVVSHDLRMVSSLCDRGIVLSDGTVDFDGDAVEAVARLRTLGWSPFVDVPHDHPLLPEMVQMVDLGVMQVYRGNGDVSEFRPRAHVTPAEAIEAIAAIGRPAPQSDSLNTERGLSRAALARLMFASAGAPLTAASSRSPFSDVPTGHPDFDAIHWLWKSDIARGWSEGNRLPTFQPAAPVSREALAAFVSRYRGLDRG